LLNEAGISDDTDIVIEAKPNVITITPLTGRRPLNRDLNTWRKQIKAAIKQGQKPEKSVWENKLSSEEENEWTW